MLRVTIFLKANASEFLVDLILEFAETCRNLQICIDPLEIHVYLSYLLLFLLFINSCSPDVEIIRPVLCINLEGIGKSFSLCLFKSWCFEEARELAHVLAQLLSKPVSGRRKGK